jgi:hypothetical protein
MVASVMAFIIVAAGSELAASMVRAIRKYEEQGELGSRSSITASFMKSALGSTAYNWTAEHIVSSTVTTGSFGEGHCAVSSNICPSTKTLRPLEICTSIGVNETTCPAPTTTSSDAIKTIVPRDGTIEAVTIQDLSVGTLGSSCSGTGNLTFRVKGSTRTAWVVDDLVMVTNNSHVNVGRVAVDFPANVDLSVERTLELDLGAAADFDLDDGGPLGDCSPKASFLRAEVMRIKQVIVKHDNATKTLLYGERASAAGTMAFSDLTTEVEDFGVRLEAVRVPGPSAAPVGVHGSCVSDTSDIFYTGAAFGAGTCSGNPLNGNIAQGPVVRVIGMQLGVVLRSGIATQIADETDTGVFDRPGTVASDKRLHRKSFFFLGLPNANAF